MAAVALPTDLFADDPELTVLHYYGYGDSKLHLDYIAKYGRSPKFMFTTSDLEALNMLKRGFDIQVVYICMPALSAFVAESVIEKWDFDRIPNSTYRFAGDVLGDRSADLSEYLVPYEFGNLFLTYNADQVPRADVQNLEIFKNPNYSGKISLPAYSEDLFTLSLLATGVDNWDTLTEAEFEAAVTWLEEVHLNLPSYWEHEEELVDQFIVGDILVAWAWNSVGYYARDVNKAIRYAEGPDVGYGHWTCGFVKTKTNHRRDTMAYDYVNAVLSETNAEQLVDWGLGLANEKAFALYYDEDTRREVGLHSPEGPRLTQSSLPADLYLRFVEEFERIRKLPKAAN
ncbi:MAG: extracellular solute-binding protein [Rhodobacter sp.]|nr:extracellular solute-binding protein [Rhodobacter sp.]